MIVLFVLDYQINNQQKLLIENGANIKDINTSEEITSKSKETLFSILQQVLCHFYIIL